jgi:hypothetical protein
MKPIGKDERVILRPAEALAMLPESDTIHTFRQGPGIIIGADWTRAQIDEVIQAVGVIELSGPQATAMNHGLCLKDGHGWLFIETKPSFDAQRCEEVGGDV